MADMSARLRAAATLPPDALGLLLSDVGQAYVAESLQGKQVSGEAFAGAGVPELVQWGVTEAAAMQCLAALAGAAVPPSLLESLTTAGQAHVLAHAQRGLLSLEAQLALVDELSAIDLKRVADAFESTTAASGEQAEAQAVGPPADWDSVAQLPPDQRQALEARGRAEIKAGKVAVVILGGGQGTRLGFDGPKGLYDIGLPSRKSLFQLYAERLLRLQQLVTEADPAGGPAVVPLYVMTSPLNHNTTRSFFADHSFFGLDPAHVHFFPQGTLPALTSDGKIVMKSAGQVALAPDGNGGIYHALATSGALAELEEVYASSCVHVFSVDNAICKVADPLFIGYCVDKGADVGNKCVWKRSPSERVGVVAQRGGKPAIVEYTELSQELCEQTTPEGKLVFGAGNICNHFFSLSFLKRVIAAYRDTPQVIPYHMARKKVPFADPTTGVTTTPEEPNAIKLEAFIFDSFPLAATSAILEVPRQDEFSPVKNAPGAASDTPDTAREMIRELHQRWVQEAGAGFNQGTPVVEVSPLVSLDGENLSGLSGRTFDATAEQPLHIISVAQPGL
mmetsp:Transcript_20304/g.59319  ORF Transcript_20304/g.59319 Transcript_20304/m.59319 type:complete len:563 (-) Transcript_20304:113-1801(-)